MSFDPDTTRAVRSWLRDGPDRLPERVLDSVLDAVPSTQQRRPRWPAWRMPAMSPVIRTGLAVALVALGVVAGAIAMSAGGRTAVPTTAPVPTPQAVVPTAAPASTPGPNEIAITSLGKDLEKGEHHFGSPFDLPFSITLPPYYRLSAFGFGEAAVQGPDGYVGVFLPEGVQPDSCIVTGALRQRSADQFVSALTHIKDWAAGPITETTIDGNPARRFTISNTIDTRTERCTYGLMLALFSYLGNSGGGQTNGGATEEFTVFDVDGRTVFIVTDGWSSPGGLDRLHEIAASIRFQ